jgi:restriction system protein
MRSANRQLEVALADELIQRIRAGTPGFFESLVVRLLVGMGYGGSVTDVTKALVGGIGDGGVDGIIDQDHLGLDRIYVQAKRYAEGNTVGSGAIRDFFGSLDRYKASMGLFVTASTFSPSTRQTADHRPAEQADRAHRRRPAHAPHDPSRRRLPHRGDFVYQEGG